MSISLPGGPTPCPGQVGTPGVNAGTALPLRCSEVTLLRQSFLGPPTLIPHPGTICCLLKALVSFSEGLKKGGV